VTQATVSADGETITVHIPLTFRKRGGRKRVVTPDGAEWAPRPRVDNAMVKALARAFRWRKMLDDGVYATIEDLAKAKGINATYVSRVLRLTLLAPNTVDAILDGRQQTELQLDDLLTGFPLEWETQACIWAKKTGKLCWQAQLPDQP
jgi:ABC-type nitrate/sulfonate/bicarbonate transport system substrate-binding protein